MQKRMQQWMQRALKSAIVVCVSWIAAGGSAVAQDHPYAGVWGEAGIEEGKANPELSGPKGCYNKFTQQMPDGRFRYYLVDSETWIKERKIEYLLAQDGQCTIEGKKEKCVGQVIGEKSSEWFITYQAEDSAGIKATYYENRFYFDKGFNGARILRHRCPFDIAKVQPFISGNTIADCKSRCRAFGPSEIAQFRDMVQTFGVTP